MISYRLSVISSFTPLLSSLCPFVPLSLCAFVPLCLSSCLPPLCHSWPRPGIQGNRTGIPYAFPPLCLCAFVPLCLSSGSGSGLVVWENQFLRGRISDCDPERFFQTSKPDPWRDVLSEQTEDAQFGAQALVVVVLGIGGAFFVDEDQLGAESEEGDGAVEDGELVGA